MSQCTKWHPLLIVLVAGCSSGSAAPPDAALEASGASDRALESSYDRLRPDRLIPDLKPPPPPIISQMSTSQCEAETHLVMAGGKGLAVWMAFGKQGLANGYALAENDGQVWSAASVLTGKPTMGDPVATVGADGSWYYGFLDGSCSSGNCTGGHVWVARKLPSASGFSPAVDASPADPLEFYDKPWLMTALDGTLILTFAARQGTYPDSIDHIIAARSSDGASWTRTDVVPKRPKGQVAGIPHACISRKSSRVWVAHVDLTTSIYAAIRWSDDGALTWPAGNQSSGFALGSEADQLQAYDLRCVGEGSDVWLMYGLASQPATVSAIPPLYEIHVAHSIDAGKSWAERGVIKMAGRQFLRPEIVLEPGGALDVVAYSGTAEGDAKGAVWWWRSTDGGKTFLDQGSLYQPIRFTGKRSDCLWIGDYSGVAFDGGKLRLTIADNSSGAAHIAYVAAPIK